MSTNAYWHFPPSKGGIDYIQDPSRSHFSNQPITNVVREVIQNSLDARQPGLSQVGVAFTEVSINRDDIGADELRLHIEQCLKRATLESRVSIKEVYELALDSLSHETIRCLKIHDTGTTGLRDGHWDALVLKEGAVLKEESGTSPGGTYGIGKNAVLNVSDLMTVFYSTRYVAGRKGRVEFLQGKATLMTHPDPQGSDGERLQHIGFYRTADQEPMRGTHEIPSVFRLDETGTGIYIIGFNPHSDDWVAETKAAVITNFFHCIHNQALEVRVESLGGNESIINYQTIEIEFEELTPDSPVHHYYRAIRNQNQSRKATINAPKPIGPLDIYLINGTGPRRGAFINQKGMLISDSKDQQINPIAPLGRTAWPDYTLVVMPSTKEGAEFLSLMENPNHTALSPSQLRDVTKQKKARESLRETRLAIRSFIDEAISLDEPEDYSNVTELTHRLPEGKPNLTRHLMTRVLAEDERTPREENLIPPLEGKDSEGIPRPPEPSIGLKNARIIHLSGNKAVLAFTPSGTPLGKLSVTLRPAGEEPTREKIIPIEKAKAISPTGITTLVHNGVLQISPIPEDRVTVEVRTTTSIEDLAMALEAR